MTEIETLKAAIRTGSTILKPILLWANPTALLAALAEMESSFGAFNRPRYEKAYAPMGAYYSKEQRERYLEWGAWACCSYSSFQIMYPTACELGFDSEPWKRSPAELMNDQTAIYFVCNYIKKRIIERDAVTNVTQFGIVYNGGSLSTGSVAAHEYGKNLALAYETVLNRRVIDII